MRPFLLLCVALASAQAAGANTSPPATAKWKTVFDQYRSSVSLPYSTLMQVPNPTGLTFKTKDGRVIIRLWTITEPRPDFPGHNPNDDMDLKKSDCDAWPPNYRKTTGTVASYSCVLHGRVSYYLGRYSQSGSVTLLVTYPVSLKRPWDDYVNRMAKSLKQVERRELR